MWKSSAGTASRCVKTRRWWSAPTPQHPRTTGWKRRRTGKWRAPAERSAPWVYRLPGARRCESFWISPFGSPVRVLVAYCCRERRRVRAVLTPLKVMMWPGVWERSSVSHLIPVRWRRLVQPCGRGLSEASWSQQRLSALISVYSKVSDAFCFLENYAVFAQSSFLRLE